MGESSQHLYVTFATTSEAIAFERAARAAGIQERLVSVPRKISAGCGYAWRAPVQARGLLESLISKQGLCFDEFHEL